MVTGQWRKFKTRRKRTMTKTDYTAYEVRVATFMKDEHINCLSSEGEPYYSVHRCDCCRNTDAGQRYFATGFNPATREVYEFQICSDCAYYAEYGQLDDMTMLDLTND
jgi:hypothetical protein